MVQVLCGGGDGPAGFRDGFQGIVKESHVVGLELDLAFRGKDPVIEGHELRGGEAALGVPVLGPRVGEVQVDAVHFALGEDVRKGSRVNAEEVEVGQEQEGALFHGLQKYAGVALDADIVDFGVGSGKFCDETAFSHTHFDVERMVIAEK